MVPPFICKLADVEVQSIIVEMYKAETYFCNFNIIQEIVDSMFDVLHIDNLLTRFYNVHS